MCLQSVLTVLQCSLGCRNTGRWPSHTSPRYDTGIPGSSSCQNVPLGKAGRTPSPTHLPLFLSLSLSSQAPSQDALISSTTTPQPLYPRISPTTSPRPSGRTSGTLSVSHPSFFHTSLSLPVNTFKATASLLVVWRLSV